MLDVLACPQYPLPLPRGQAQSAVPCICRGVSAPGPRTLLMVHSHRNKRLEQPLKESQAGTVQLHRHPGPPALCHPLARRHPLVPLHCPAGSCEGLSRPAMLLLGCSSKLWLLEGMLRRGLPDTLPVTRICPCSRERTGKVYGAVMHVNRGNPARSEVLVDSWPEFKIVLTRPQRAVAWERNDYGTNLYAAFYRDEGACRALLANTQAVDWGQAFQMQGLQRGVYETIRDTAKARGLELEMYPYLPLLHPDPPALPQERPSEGFRLAPVSPAHALLLSDAWMFGGNSWSLCYVSHLIRDFPNACLLAPEGHPVSWSLSDPLAALTQGYTLPEYRGKHHAGSVVGMLGAHLHALGFPVYSRVLPHNKSSLRTMQRLGFQILPGVFYQLVVTPAFGQSLPASTLH
ncbi:glycine N-acyltransferase-like protein 3 isoform X2 [Pelodiscus sinensis]|uniref:glycine N-acyltransferase-like protein 3 isoform X2 n=1 Tax=Pelodiscus sinensis TaxID=13735 RepID=UPI003F6AE2A2